MTGPEICAAVRQHYGLAVRAVERIDRGSAALFKLYGSEAAFILKVFQPKFRADSILREVHVTDFLRQNGISVPEYIPCRNGDFYFMQNGRIAILQAFIPGQTREKGCCSKRELLDSARLLAQIVNALEHYPYDDLLPCEISRYGSAARLLQAKAAYADLMAAAHADAVHGAEICRDLQDRLVMIARVSDAGAFVNTNALTLKRSHGDYSVMQLLYDGSEIKAVLDFVNAGEVPIAWELIRSYSYMDCTFNAARLAAYTNEYRRYAEVSMDDLRYMPYLYLGQLLSSTYGYKQYLQTGDEELLAFGRWRTEMCRYLIANAGEVSAELVRLA